MLTGRISAVSSVVGGVTAAVTGDDCGVTSAAAVADTFKVTEEVVDSKGIYVMDGLLALSVVAAAVVEDAEEDDVDWVVLGWTLGKGTQLSAVVRGIHSWKVQIVNSAVFWRKK